MAERIPEISEASLVLVGSFNASIFQPEWFARQGLLSQSEVDTAKITIVHPEICQFETETLTIQVTKERFIASSKQDASPAPLRDLVLGTFFILEHTPITAMGINRLMHFRMESDEKWHQLGDKLAPKEGWKDVLEGRPGMRSLLITAERLQPVKSTVNAKVEPSTRIHPGAYFEINEHFPGAEVDSAKSLLDVLREHWEGAQIYGSTIANHILDWADK
jgi:hypothetical protein